MSLLSSTTRISKAILQFGGCRHATWGVKSRIDRRGEGHRKAPLTIARRTVWIVDDSPLEAERARRVLEALYDVRCFADGESTVEALRQRRRPDVLVLDWILPGLTGADVCRFARSFSGHDPMSILIVTASGREQVAEGLAAGANDYLAKHYTDEELIARTGALVRASELAERVEQAEETVRKLLTHTPDGIIVVDIEGRLIYANAE